MLKRFKLKNIQLKIAMLLSLAFFILGIITLPDYGINWDTVNHLPRGQVYLHYFLTGKKDFSDLSIYKKYWQKPEDFLPSKSIVNQTGTLRSYYQNEAYNFNYYMEIDGAGHPPLSDIISSIFNRVLFGKLKIVNDIDSYRVYGVLLASALVGLIYFWTSEIYGSLAGFVAFLSLALYPLFFSESHFNTEKDIPETVYWSFFLYCIWNGFTKKSWKWIILSGLLFGLALGTKLNIVFSVFVIIPWILVYLGKSIFKKEYIKLFYVGILSFVLGLFIFYSTWPYLWQDLIGGTAKFLGFYKLIGSGYSLDPRFTGPFNLNTYPALWILYTTPVIVLFLTFLGLIFFLKEIKFNKSYFGVLILLWFLTPIIRVSLPGAGIYGGVRQIMEYIPAMAILAGVGAKLIFDFYKSKFWNIVTVLFISISFISLLLKLQSIHPNENAFFNKLIGGLNGAKAAKIPSWGNTFGAGYRQGFKWLNEHAERGSLAVFAHELMPNAPLIWIRPDIDFYNTARSGFLRRGEYAISLTYDGTIGASYYDAYLENFLDPVYQSVVDGVPVVKVWKNDEAHTKQEFKKQSIIGNIYWNNLKDGVLIDLRGEYHLSHLIVEYSDKKCNENIDGNVFLSNDSKKWIELPETIPTGSLPVIGEQPKNGQLFFPFLGDKARFIKIKMKSDFSCLRTSKNVTVYQLPDIK